MIQQTASSPVCRETFDNAPAQHQGRAETAINPLVAIAAACSVCVTCVLILSRAW